MQTQRITICDVLDWMLGRQEHRTPFKQQKEVRQSSVAVEQTDHTTILGGRRFTSYQEDIDGAVVYTSDLMTSIKTFQITKADVKELEKNDKLDKGKYIEMKRVWAEGTSAAQASKDAHGRRGYGHRVLQTYWAAYNRAAES